MAFLEILMSPFVSPFLTAVHSPIIPQLSVCLHLSSAFIHQQPWWFMYSTLSNAQGQLDLSSHVVCEHRSLSLFYFIWPAPQATQIYIASCCVRIRNCWRKVPSQLLCPVKRGLPALHPAPPTDTHIETPNTHIRTEGKRERYRHIHTET